MTEVEQPRTAEQKTYLPDQELAWLEKRDEGDKLIREFVNIFKGDPDVQRILVETYFNYNSAGFMGRNGTLHFKRGTGEYTLNTLSSATEMDWFSLTRVTRGGEDSHESLNIDRGLIWEHEGVIGVVREPLIQYVSFNDVEISLVTGKIVTSEAKNTGSAVDKGRNLLAKVRKDFGKANPLSGPNAASSQ